MVNVELIKRSWGEYNDTPENRAKIEQLAAAATNGDRRSLEELYFALVCDINRFARRYGGRLLTDGYEYDDLCQEAFIVFDDLLRDWQGEDFRRFFFGVFPWRLRRHFSKLARSWRRIRIDYLPVGELEALLESLVQEDRACDAVCAGEYLHDLTPWQRQVVLHHIEKEESFSQIAARLGISKTKAFRIYNRAVRKMRETV